MKYLSFLKHLMAFKSNFDSNRFACAGAGGPEAGPEVGQAVPLSTTQEPFLFQAARVAYFTSSFKLLGQRTCSAKQSFLSGGPPLLDIWPFQRVPLFFWR